MQVDHGFDRGSGYEGFQEDWTWALAWAHHLGRGWYSTMAAISAASCVSACSVRKLWPGVRVGLGHEERLSWSQARAASVSGIPARWAVRSASRMSRRIRPATVSLLIGGSAS